MAQRRTRCRPGRRDRRRAQRRNGSRAGRRNGRRTRRGDRGITRRSEPESTRGALDASGRTGRHAHRRGRRAIALLRRGREPLLERAAQEQQEIARGPDSSEGALAQARRHDVADDAGNERRERSARRGGSPRWWPTRLARTAASRRPSRRARSRGPTRRCVRRPGRARFCSGDRYAGVPITSRALVRTSPSRRSARRFAMPKSTSTTRPSAVKSRLEGLRSRCTTPARCGGDERLGGLDRVSDSGLGAHRAAFGDDPLEIEAVHVVHRDPRHVTRARRCCARERPRVVDHRRARAPRASTARAPRSWRSPEGTILRTMRAPSTSRARKARSCRLEQDGARPRTGRRQCRER